MIRFIRVLVVLIFIVFLNGCRWQTHSSIQGYIEGKFTYIASQTSGTLQKIYVKEGDSITQGAPLFRLDSAPQAAQVKEAEAKLYQTKFNLSDLRKGKRPTEIAAIEAQKNQIQAQLDFAQKMLIRYQQLYHKGFIEKSRLDESLSNVQNFKAQLVEINENLKTSKLAAREDEVKAAEANVVAAKAALANILWQLNQTMIQSPIAGLVFDVFYREGEVVPINYPVLELLAPENIYAVFFVPEKELSFVHLNQVVHIFCDGCQKTSAKITFISPEAEFTPPVIYSEKTRAKLVYRIEAHFAPTDAIRFHPGQPISVTIR